MFRNDFLGSPFEYTILGPQDLHSMSSEVIRQDRFNPDVQHYIHNTRNGQIYSLFQFKKQQKPCCGIYSAIFNSATECSYFKLLPSPINYLHVRCAPRWQRLLWVSGVTRWILLSSLAFSSNSSCCHMDTSLSEKLCIASEDERLRR